MRYKNNRQNEEIKPEIETFAKIKVIGVGGSGGSAIDRMISDKIRGVEFVAINSDAQALHHSNAPHKLHIGRTTTRGLGAGMDPELGRKAVEENQDEIHEMLKGSDMVFITCGLGGGTGTGASPMIADIARDVGALTVAVVTKPFAFEGAQRKQIAENGLGELTDKVDTIITIPNDRILQIIDKKTSLLDAFGTVDEVLRQGVQGISDLITVPGLINVDFADVKSIMENAGSALMGIGQGSGENRAVDAAKAAIDSPLLELSIEGAKGILFTITGGPNLGMYEVNEAARIITASADPNARVIFGSVIDEAMKDMVKITVIATGFGGKQTTIKKIKPLEFGNREERPQRMDFSATRVNRPASQPAPMSPPRNNPIRPSEKEPPKTKEEEDLEIPAFIRKKMM
ncbi:MAG: cell division protein FtsZ [Patescibacteria group bacterium]|jgi:cell division protein FtsZ